MSEGKAERHTISITDETIERAAIAIRRSVTASWSKDAADIWHFISDDMRNRYRKDARMALNAAANQ